MRNAAAIALALLVAVTPVQAVSSGGIDRPPAGADEPKRSTFWSRLYEFVVKRVRNEPTAESKAGSMGGGDALSIAGVSPLSIAYVPRSDGDLAIPWYSVTPSRIVVRRGDQVLAERQAPAGANQLALPGGRSVVGKLTIDIEQRRDDGTPLPSRFLVRIVDPADAPRIPADELTKEVSERLQTTVYWSTSYDFCFYRSQNPQCGRWRLAAYQEWLAMRTGTPAESVVAERFINEMQSGD